MKRFSKLVRRPMALFMVMAMVLSLFSGMAVRTPDKVVAAGNILRDTEFTDVTSADSSEWTAYVGSDWAYVNATVTGNGDGSMTVDYDAIGGGWADALWGLQISQTDVAFEANKAYKLSFTVTSDGAKGMKVKLDGYEAYLDYDVAVEAGTNTYTVDIPANTAAYTTKFLFAMGWMAGDDSAASPTVTISNVSIVESTGAVEPPAKTIYEVGDDVLADNAFAELGTTWETYVGTDWSGAQATFTQGASGEAVIDITNVGWSGEWGIQFVQKNINLAEAGEYLMSFKTHSTGNKQIKVFLQSGGDLIGQTLQLEAGKTQDWAFVSTEVSANTVAELFFALSQCSAADEATTLTITDISICPIKKTYSVGDNVIVDAEFNDMANTWFTYLGTDWSGCVGSIKQGLTGEANIDIEAVGGENEWSFQFAKNGNVSLEANKDYVLQFSTYSTANKQIKVYLQNNGDVIGQTIKLKANETQNWTFTGTNTAATDAASLFYALGFVDAADEAGDITLFNVGVYPVAVAEEEEPAEVTEITLAANKKDVTIQRAYNDERPNAPLALIRVYDSLAEAEADEDRGGYGGYGMSLNSDGVWEVSTSLAEELAEGQVIKYYFVDFDAIGAGYNSDFGYYSLFVAADYESAKTIEEMEADGWNLVWNDEFDGTALDTTKWSYQIGNGKTASNNPGWGNQEMEYYTDSTDNVSVADGKLTITAKKETTTDPNEGTFNYTSGRIRTVSDTENLFSTKYGRIEAYMSLPMEVGAWPAFWMLPDNQDIYGGWAASGEIDIMEGWGNNNYATCGTVHYGGNWPNNLYKGKTYNFDSATTNVGAYHLYALEWEPGKLTWYVDDELLYTTDIWNSIGKNAGEDFTFGAPFDVPFYLMLNVAVGGTFGAGDPAEGDYSGNGLSSMSVDYVRVYQSEDGYDESGVVAGGSAGDASAYDTYVRPLLEAAGLDSYEGYNFAGDTSFDTLNTVGAVDPEDSSWQFYVGGEFGGAATVGTVEKDGTTYAAIDTTSAGNQAYAIQLIKHMPMINGYTYKVSFDAYAEAERNVTIHPSGDADNGWAGYASETISVGTTPENYSFYFTMGNDSDPTARLEFNLGTAGTADIFIGNVVVEMVSQDDIEETTSKTELPDGNIIWNGTFDQGKDRLGFWNTTDADVKVPSYVLYELGYGDIFSYDKGEKQNYARRAEITATGANASISQDGLTLKQSDQYSLKLDVYSEADIKVTVTVTNKDGSVVYSSETLDYTAGAIETLESVFAMPKDVTDKEAVVTIGFEDGAELLVDNIMLVAITENNTDIDYSNVNTTPVPEDSTGWYTNYHQAGNVAAVPDADGVYTVETWKDVNNYQSMFLHELDLVAGVTYKFSFEAKSDVENTYTVGMQEDNTWAMAWGTENFTTTPEWDTYEYEFVSALTTGGNPLYLKYLLSDCENTSNIYLRNLKLEAVVTTGAKDPEEGSAALEADTVKVGEDVVINLADNDWAETFVANATDADGKAVIMINEVPLDVAKLVDMVSDDKITLPGSYFAEAGEYKIELAVDGYNNCVLGVSVEAAEEESTEESSEATTESTEGTTETTTESTTAAGAGDVNTGDAVNIIVWLMLIILAGVVFTGVVLKRRTN